MIGQHHKLILQINKALSILSKKVYTDVLSEIDPNEDYSLFDVLTKCRNELAKIDEHDIIKIANMVEKEISITRHIYV